MEECKKKSIGKLHKAAKTKPRSPIMTGKLNLQRATLETILRQLKQQGGNAITCNLAAWKNRDADGDYLTIELSPLFEIRALDEQDSITAEEFFETLQEDD